jgi:arginase family enzyme
MQAIKVPGLNPEKGEDTRGCRNAGNEIIKLLDEIQVNEKGKIIDRQLLDLEEIHVNNFNLKEQEELIYENSLEAFEKKEKIAFLGGDHSISYPILNAFLDYSKKERKIPCLIVFDSMPSCKKPEKFPENRQWLRAIIENGFPIENILLVGVNKMKREELEFISRNKIKIINLNQIEEDISETTDYITEFASGKMLYVSIDLNVLDSSLGGLKVRQLIYILSRIFLIKSLKVLEISEVSIEKDKEKREVRIASKILAEFL